MPSSVANLDSAFQKISDILQDSLWPWLLKATIQTCCTTLPLTLIHQHSQLGRQLFRDSDTHSSKRSEPCEMDPPNINRDSSTCHGFRLDSLPVPACGPKACSVRRAPKKSIVHLATLPGRLPGTKGPSLELLYVAFTVTSSSVRWHQGPYM